MILRSIQTGKALIYHVDDPNLHEIDRTYLKKFGGTSVLEIPLKSGGEFNGVIEVWETRTKREFTKKEIFLCETIASQAAIAIQNAGLFVEIQDNLDTLQKTLDGTVNALATTAEKRDPYTSGHQEAVKDFALAIAKEMNLTSEEIEGLGVACVLHDIGKIYVPAEILNKPGKLSDPEMEMIKTHPEVGKEILKSVEFPWPVAEIVLQHHERINGSGYPRGLKGEEILIETKVLAVADIVNAISSHRPYRPALGLDVAIEELKKNRGKLYDPDVVDAALKLLENEKFSFN